MTWPGCWLQHPRQQSICFREVLYYECRSFFCAAAALLFFRARLLNTSDIAQGEGEIGRSRVDGTNFRNGINADGSIGASDISLVKTAAGTSIP